MRMRTFLVSLVLAAAVTAAALPISAAPATREASPITWWQQVVQALGLGPAAQVVGAPAAGPGKTSPQAAGTGGETSSSDLELGPDMDPDG